MPDEARLLLESLGLTPVINAAGSPSRLGGTAPSAGVRAAMDAAGQHFMPLAEMQEVASTVISRATGAEAGCVASGAAACLFLATAACMARDDRAAMDRLPDTTGLRNEVAVHRAHRNPFDHAVRATGAKLVEFGYLGIPSGIGTHLWQLRAALTERTAAIFYLAENTEQVLPLDVVVEVAHAQGLPVIVDAAGAVPPAANLRRFVEQGADLVAFSGGKALGGPAASGFLAGRRDLIRSATLQQQDMHIYPGLWAPPLESEPAESEPPHQGLGRALKVGREELAGIIVALQEYVARNHDADYAGWLELCSEIASCFDASPVGAATVTPGAGQIPRVLLRFQSPRAAFEFASTLENGRPRVFVATTRIPRAELIIFPNSVREWEVAPLLRRLADCLPTSPKADAT